MNTITETVAAITSNQETEMVNTANLKNLITLKQRSPDLDQSLNDLGAAFISANNPLPFVTRVEDLANQHHIVLQMNIGQPDKALTQPIKPVLTDLTFTGSWSNVLLYTQALMADPTYIVVKQIHFDSGVADQVTVTMHALTYWRS